MYNIAHGISWKFPNSRGGTDFWVEQHEDGTFTLDHWYMKDANGVGVPQPTQSDLVVWTLSAAQADKRNVLNTACENAVYVGFTSSALGAPHQYSFNFLDQQNFNEQLHLIIIDPTITTVPWKTDDAGVQNHTVDQFKQVVKDAATFKNQQISKYRTLMGQVLSATTPDAVNAINW